jgi:alcohol dehydrogenase
MHATTRHNGTTSGLPGFDFQPRTRVVFGEDALERVGELARELGGRRVLLVTDKGIVSAGHPARAIGFLEAAGLHVTTFDEVRENPTTEDVDRGVAVARADGIDLIVGLGGGSSMDTAKGTNFILTNGGHMKDYWGVGKATKPMLPMIAIPTTAGTGSE